MGGSVYRNVGAHNNGRSEGCNPKGNLMWIDIISRLRWQLTWPLGHLREMNWTFLIFFVFLSQAIRGRIIVSFSLKVTQPTLLNTFSSTYITLSSLALHSTIRLKKDQPDCTDLFHLSKVNLKLNLGKTASTLSRESQGYLVVAQLISKHLLSLPLPLNTCIASQSISMQKRLSLNCRCYHTVLKQVES